MGTIEIINIHNKNIPSDGVCIYIGRNKEGNVLGNPYTTKSGTLAQYVVADRDTAISEYETYFKESYQNNNEFRKKIDEIYDKYTQGKKIYLGCFCTPLPCHGDVIKKYIEMRFLDTYLKK